MIFLTIMLPTAMLIWLRKFDENNAIKYYEFIKLVKLCVQNFTKPDRIFHQVTDFNIRYFDIPDNLFAIYNVFLYYAKNALNVTLPETSVKGEYEFLLCPDMNRQTEVKELFQGTDGAFNAERQIRDKKVVQIEQVYPVHGFGRELHGIGRFGRWSGESAGRCWQGVSV